MKMLKREDMTFEDLDQQGHSPKYKSQWLIQSLEQESNPANHIAGLNTAHKSWFLGKKNPSISILSLSP